MKSGSVLAALYPENQQSWLKKNSVMQYLPSTPNAIQFAVCALAISLFRTAYSCYTCVCYWQENNLADSSIAQAKNIVLNITISSCLSHWWRFLTAISAVKSSQVDKDTAGCRACNALCTWSKSNSWYVENNTYIAK